MYPKTAQNRLVENGCSALRFTTAVFPNLLVKLPYTLVKQKMSLGTETSEPWTLTFVFPLMYPSLQLLGV